MKKSIALTAVALIALVGLVGCTESESTENKSNSKLVNLMEVEQSLTDGRSVTCLMDNGSRAGGLSCDWENAK